MKILLPAIIIAASLCTSSAHAAETITYTYDAKGRLVKVVRTGPANNAVLAQYNYDKSNNRKNVTVSGSANQTPP